MKHRIKKTKKRLHELRKRENRYRLFIAPQAAALPPAAPHTTPHKRTVFIYEGEHRRLCLETLHMGAYGLETGGQFFGIETWNGALVITYVLGPGPNAKHSPAFFQQDIQYLKQEADRLMYLGSLRQIGEWHSHHHLGLSVPSGRDSNSMKTAIRMHKEMSRYLLCIAVCDDRFASATPFMYNLDGYETWAWDIIPGESPVRKMLENV